MIAACDTFRSGAVEQLKTHCMRLGVPLYERGYEKDPAKVAFEAAKAAERSKIDVLLVDTAGEPPGWLRLSKNGGKHSEISPFVFQSAAWSPAHGDTACPEGDKAATAAEQSKIGVLLVVSNSTHI